MPLNLSVAQVALSIIIIIYFTAKAVLYMFYRRENLACIYICKKITNTKLMIIFLWPLSDVTLHILLVFSYVSYKDVIYSIKPSKSFVEIAEKSQFQKILKL